MIDIAKVKLVIWDLDDTFWNGTLSEGEVIPIASNVRLIKDLTDRGIVNSICSKNDYDISIKKLQDFGIEDYFVFKSIDWTPKGQRISKMIKDMGLRPVNCLFIDDNIVNLNEAQFYSNDLMIASPDEILDLLNYCKNTEVTDCSHNRLNQYKVLEKKQKAKENASDNLQFLYASNTEVKLHSDCKDEEDRIYELINRTNQLNYTKYRCTREELSTILNDSEANCGYVTVKDNYGDYGIVGFYAIKNNKCIHFLFSCRTIGQGVEQWVYSTLGCPDLTIVGEVVNIVENRPAPDWINQGFKIDEDKRKTFQQGRIVFKGPCDMDILTSFLNVKDVVTEFTYIGSKYHNSIEHHNHSVNYLQFPFLSSQQRGELLSLVFNDENAFSTKIYEEDIALVFISTLIEPNLGIYENKRTGYKIAYGEWTVPLTDRRIWNRIIRGEFNNFQNKFTEEFLTNFCDDYSFIGRLTPQQSFENIQELFGKISPKTHLCLLLGSETPYLKNTNEAYNGRESYHKELNEMVKNWAYNNSRVHYIDFNDYITGQEDFLDNINHFQRNIYFKASVDANCIIEEVLGYKLKGISIGNKVLDYLARSVRDYFNPNTNFYYYLRKLYHIIRGGKAL